MGWCLRSTRRPESNIWMGCFHSTVKDNRCEDRCLGLPLYFISFFIFLSFQVGSLCGQDTTGCIQRDETCHESPKAATPKGQQVLKQRFSSLRYSLPSNKSGDLNVFKASFVGFSSSTPLCETICLMKPIKKISNAYAEQFEAKYFHPKYYYIC